MRSEVSDVNTTTKEVHVEIPKEDVTRAFDQTLRSMRKNVRISGFRQGKAPLDMVRARVGDDLGHSVAEQLLDRFTRKVLVDHSLSPIPGSLTVRLGEGEEAPPPAIEDEEYSFTLSLDVMPTIELGEIEGIEINKPAVELDDNEIDEEIEKLRTSLARLTPVDGRASQLGDSLEVDIEGAEMGEEPRFPRGTQMIEIGKEGNLPDFDRGLVGLEAGQDFAFECTYPDDFSEETLKGKVLYFKGTVRNLLERSVPELNDEFAQQFGEEMNTVDKLKEKIGESLLARKEQEASSQARAQLLEKLLESHSFDAPPSLVESRLREQLARLGEHLTSQGLDPETMDIDWEQVIARERKDCEKGVREAMLLDAVAAQEGLTVEKDELERAIGEIAAQAKEKVSAVRTKLTQGGGLQSLKNQILRRQTLDWLIAKSHIA